MYSIKAILDKTPIQISAAVVVILNFVIIMGWIAMTGLQVAASNSALTVLLGLFVANKTANKAVLKELDQG